MDDAFGILLVDNDAALRRTVSAILHTWNSRFRILEADDSDACLDALARQRIHLVVMDIRLGAENGLVLTERVKKRYPHLTVVIHSICDSREYRQRARQIGADHFLSKTTNSVSDMLRVIQSFYTNFTNASTQP